MLRTVTILILFLVCTHVDAGSFVSLAPSEVAVTFHYEASSSSEVRPNVKPLKFVIRLGARDQKTSFRKPLSLTLQVGRKTFELSSEDLNALGFCSFEGCGSYVGPQDDPQFYYLTFKRIGPKGQKQQVTLEFSKERQGINHVTDLKS
jgi:hypothetical protein